MFKDKILAQLRTRYAGKGLSEKAFNALADRIAKTVTEENQIEAGVADVEDSVNIIQSEADAARAAAKKEASGSAKQDEGGNGHGAQGQPAGGDGANANKQGKGGESEPDWKTAFAEMQKEIADLKSGNVASTRLTKLNEKLAGVPDDAKAKFLKQYGRMTFKDDADFEEYLTDTTTEAQSLIQKKATDDLGQQHRPFTPATTTAAATAGDQIKAWAAQNKAAATSASAAQ
ncbi:hypothetical protein [Fibrella forsythiae]|uniref:Uncharacterized protein n=1 Tax=Fibrella forsythiae TaxID=2817061 RepID=A0ABS3JBD4_9BACT|nr:hypothetical protein [Fibrella forsythiae]MBO0947289.1 hypothetical protein [Fibrella forsythiae]